MDIDALHDLGVAELCTMPAPFTLHLRCDGRGAVGVARPVGGVRDSQSRGAEECELAERDGAFWNTQSSTRFALTVYERAREFANTTSIFVTTSPREYACLVRRGALVLGPAEVRALAMSVAAGTFSRSRLHGWLRAKRGVRGYTICEQTALSGDHPREHPICVGALLAECGWELLAFEVHAPVIAWDL